MYLKAADAQVDVIALLLKDYAGNELAKHLDVSAQYVCDLTRGRRKLSRQILQRLAKPTRKGVD